MADDQVQATPKGPTWKQAATLLAAGIVLLVSGIYENKDSLVLTGNFLLVIGIILLVIRLTSGIRKGPPRKQALTLLVSGIVLAIPGCGIYLFAFSVSSESEGLTVHGMFGFLGALAFVAGVALVIWGLITILRSGRTSSTLGSTRR